MSNILDIGCGCGVISLMLAQRFPEAHVTGIDIDRPSVLQARQNALDSPFADRLDFRVADVREITGTSVTSGTYETLVTPETFGTPVLFDLIVSNPPFYLADTMPPNERRALARNAHNLLPAELIASAGRLLSFSGSLALVLPMEARDTYVDTALQQGLYLRRECHVRTTPRKQPKRLLLQFYRCKPGNDYSISELCLLDPDGTRSEQYKSLCSAFYLDS